MTMKSQSTDSKTQPASLQNVKLSNNSRESKPLDKKDSYERNGERNSPLIDQFPFTTTDQLIKSSFDISDNNRPLTDQFPPTTTDQSIKDRKSSFDNSYNNRPQEDQQLYDIEDPAKEPFYAEESSGENQFNEQQHSEQPQPQQTQPQQPQPQKQPSAQERLDKEWISYRNQKMKEEAEQMKREFMKEYEKSTAQPPTEQDETTSKESPENKPTDNMKKWRDYLKETENTEASEPPIRPLKVIGKLKDVMKRRLGQRPIIQQDHTYNNNNNNNNNNDKNNKASSQTKHKFTKEIDRKWMEAIKKELKENAAHDDDEKRKKELNKKQNDVIDHDLGFGPPKRSTITNKGKGGFSFLFSTPCY